MLDFLRQLWSVEHGLNKTSKRMRHALGITGPQRLVLLVVARFPGLTAGELARVVHLHPSTVTGILYRLVSRGLLRKSRDSYDGRVTRLSLEKKAARFTKRSAGPVEKAVRTALLKSGPEKSRIAGEVLRAIAGELDGRDGRG